MQVGAMRALLEAGFTPDLLVGTSIGAVNVAGMAAWGNNLAALDRLERFYAAAAEAELMDPQPVRLALRALTGHPDLRTGQRLVDLLVAQGIPADLHFGQVTGVRVALVAADLDTGQPILYGEDPGERLLDGVLASAAVPPWILPIEREGHVVLDGGALSALPIEPALSLGASEIIALSIDVPRTEPVIRSEIYQLVEKLVSSVGRREVYLETALAAAQGVPMRRIPLVPPEGVQLWDFGHSAEMLQGGYKAAQRSLEDGLIPDRGGFLRRAWGSITGRWRAS
jgi:NTE family protein